MLGGSRTSQTAPCIHHKHSREEMAAVVLHRHTIPLTSCGDCPQCLAWMASRSQSVDQEAVHSVFTASLRAVWLQTHAHCCAWPDTHRSPDLPLARLAPFYFANLIYSPVPLAASSLW